MIKYFCSTIMTFVLFLSDFALPQNAYDAVHLSDNEFGFGTRAMGMGGAFTGLADDYSAIYWNPAGLGQISNPVIYSELTHTRFSNDALYGGSLTHHSRDYTRLGSFGYVMPIPTERGSLVFAFGYNRIRDFDRNLMFSGMSSLSNDLDFSINDSVYTFDENVFRMEEVDSEGGIHEWTIGGAMELSPIFTLGVSVALQRGTEDYRLHFLQIDADGSYNEYPGDFHSYSVRNLLQSEYTALSLKAGGLIQIDRNLRMGGTITLPSLISVDEVHSFDDLLLFDDDYEDTYESSGQFKYHIRTPFVFDGGLSINSKWLTVSASARYRDWSQIRFEVDRNDLADEDYSEFLDENAVIRQDYRPTVEYRVGGEMAVIPKVKLRGGYTIIPSNFQGTAGISDREFLTTGVSIQVDRYISLDASMMTGRWQEKSSDNYTPEGTDEDISLTRFTVGFSYRF